jgi:hypothetical protein
VEGSSGNVGIGTSTPSSFYSAANNLVIGTGSGAHGLTIYSGSGDSGYIGFNDTVTNSMQGFIQYNHSGDYMAFAPNGTEKVRIDSTGGFITKPAAGGGAVFNENGADANFRVESSGDANMLFVDGGSDAVGIGTGSPSSSYGLHIEVAKRAALMKKTSSADGDLMQEITWDTSGYSTIFYVASSGTAPSASATAFRIGRNNTTSRSINASGTINASGADYAEYMVKADTLATINKGDVCGIDVSGKLTTVWADAISFAVKSTDPSYVGGDTWFNEDRPQPEDVSAEEYADFQTRLEAARATVDRIAFSGQVPVNVIGATVGDYIIPVQDETGIAGQAVSSPTFEQYMSAVGKVIAIEDDGRAKIIVKVA